MLADNWSAHSLEVDISSQDVTHHELVKKESHNLLD